jgi:acyl-CoA thioester hydrolase
MAKLFTYEKLILEQHLDTLGHVNNATYIALFEEARWDLVTKNGYGIKEVHAYKKSPVILHIDIKFVAEVRLRETISIETQLAEYPSKVGKIKQVMKKADGTIACEAMFTFGLFDLEKRKLVEATPEWKKAIGME